MKPKPHALACGCYHNQAAEHPRDQTVHADPELVERAAEHIHSYIVRERLLEHDSALAAYQKGGMVTAEINAILAAEFCQALLAPVVEAYENERDRILGN